MGEPIGLTEDQVVDIEYFLERWGRLTENRDEPIMAMLDGTEVAPVDISRAMVERDGRLYRHMLALVAAGLVTGVELGEILADFVMEEGLGA